MNRSPSRFRRLDHALADLPLDEPMLLTELDGFLTGVLVCPELIMPSGWLPVIWGAHKTGGAPFEDPADAQWFIDAVMARYNEIARDLGRGGPRPILDVDERNGDVLWEFWIEGFAEAIALRPDSWPTMTEGADPDAVEASSYLTLLIAVARDESILDSVEINAVHDGAPAGITANVGRLYAHRLRSGGAASDFKPEPVSKVSRNELCPCGSGKKFKRCCG